ncbi:heavy metal translocating P-type ATPase [Inconstantimicrobium porci]|uniref:Cd(2+)-exporting ATPase n=1 Tax=Inconstantimicrobium porci TaxID=2652291 RepID=A0A7X2MWC8_9CLOT|nr:heavy metal translocating P-type ATPase [Inconstantimicrobium porci]MSR90297.1 cadmium-translocating P-type ATPase [Inconstantimicrobium porci]
MEEIKLNLKGLDCAGCAAKIEDKVGKLEVVKEAVLNFSTQTLIMKIENKENRDEAINEATKIVNTLEPDVIVSEQNGNQKNKNTDKCNGGCSCTGEHHHGHDHGAEDEEEDSKKKLIMLIAGAAAYVTGLAFINNETAKLIVFVIAYILVGGEVVLKALKNITKGQIFDENFLMVVATIGAFAIKEYPEAVAVMIFYQVGEMFQDKAVNNSRRSIKSLMDIRPDFANVIRDGKEVRVSPSEVAIGEEIVVKPGEKIPLDGVLVSGSGVLDTSALTGESLPREVDVNESVLSGCISKNGVLRIKVNKEFGESTVSKILDLVQNAGNKKAETEKFITKFARYYTPAVVITAALLAVVPPLVISGATFDQWIYRALSFLVVSCPCALVISIPLGFFGGIGAASKNGILVKGGNYLEALKNVDSVVFDKTGTLTKGVFKVTEVKSESDLSNDQLLEYAAYAESYSNHPIGLSIINEYGKDVDKDKVRDYEEISGHGIKIVYDGKHILAGNIKLMKRFNIVSGETESIGTVVYVAVDGEYAGHIIISDEIKEDSAKAMKSLKALGVKRTVMLTGDSRKVADVVAEKVGVDKVYSELLPGDKVNKIEELFRGKDEKANILFVGDGINDAPVLARADVGIAMGGIGSDAAIEAADVIIMNDEPSKIADAIKIARKTNRIVWQNIIFSLGVKVVILVLVAAGLGNMWEAVFADVGVALIAVLNAMRILKIKKL